MQPVTHHTPPFTEPNAAQTPDVSRYAELTHYYHSIVSPDPIYRVLTTFYKELWTSCTTPSQPYHQIDLLLKQLLVIDTMTRQSLSEHMPHVQRKGATQGTVELYQRLATIWQDFGQVQAYLTPPNDAACVHNSLASKGFHFIPYPSPTSLNASVQNLSHALPHNTRCSIFIGQLPSGVFSPKLLVWVINKIANNILVIKGCMPPQQKQSQPAIGFVYPSSWTTPANIIALYDEVCAPTKEGIWAPNLPAAAGPDEKMRLMTTHYETLADHFRRLSSAEKSALLRSGLPIRPMSVRKTRDSLEQQAEPPILDDPSQQ